MNKVAFDQCTTRSVRSKRTIVLVVMLVTRAGSLRLLVVATIRATDPAVDVVPELFPVAGDDFAREFDAVEPLDRLVAVHRRDIEPHGTAVDVRQVFALEAISDDH